MGYSPGGAIKALADDLTELRQGVFTPCLQEAYNRGELEIEVIKTYDEKPIMQVMRAEHDALCEDYISRGYQNTRTFAASNYKLKKRILSDYRNPIKRPPLVYITARCNNKAELVLAVFTTVPQADQWIAEAYNGNTEKIVPKFKDDELSLGYHQKYGYKLMMGKTRARGNLKKRFKGITL